MLFGAAAAGGGFVSDAGDRPDVVTRVPGDAG